MGVAGTTPKQQLQRKPQIKIQTCREGGVDDHPNLGDKITTGGRYVPIEKRGVKRKKERKKIGQKIKF